VNAMLCATLKQGVECAFMAKNGCQFNGGKCYGVVEKCGGCQKAKDFSDGQYCIAFPDPGAKWRFGRCNMATHLQAAAKKATPKVNPLKASKRGSH
jgi:hypothetical protein